MNRRAEKIGLRERGYVRKDYWADITIFDAERIADLATFEDPHRYPLGIHFVLVNGRLIFENGRRSAALPGKVLRRSGTRSPNKLKEGA